MKQLYRGLSLLSGIFVWSMVILRTTDGRSITWYKPPPSETVTDARVVSETNKNLTKGSLNEELSCEFSLTADLSIFTVTMDFDGYNLATYAGSTVVLDPRFVGRGNATWIPTKLTLTVFNVTTADAGIYECKVLTAAGTWTRKFPLTILDQSSITFISENQTVNDGDLLWLNCSAMGTPQPIPTWTILSDNRTVDMPFAITGKQDEGGYICTADNKVGNAATSVVFVTVESYRPSNTYLSTNLTNATAELNETIYLMCSAEANPAAKYRLYKGDASIANITATSQDIGLYATSVSDRVKEVVYKCIPFNSFGDGPAKKLIVTLHYPVEATGTGTNATVAEGAVTSFSCPVDGNPEPNIKWYKGSKASGEPMSMEKVLTVEGARESVCYTCVAYNSRGTAVSILQCLIVDQTLTTVSSTTALQQREQIQAFLTIITTYEQAFGDLNSASSKEFVSKFVEEMDKVYRNMPEYVKTEVTQLRAGSVIVYFTLYFKTALTPEKGLEKLRLAISSNGTFGDLQAKDLGLSSEESATSTTTTEIICTCTDKETTLLIVIGVLVTIIILLIAVIIWQHRKLRIIGSKRPYDVPEERDAEFYDNEVAMKDLNPTHLRPKNSAQQQNPNELAYMPLRGISPTGEGPITPERPAPNVEYAPLDMRTRSWEVERDDVKVEKTIGKGAFGQVAKGTAKNLRFKSGATSVAIKMVKANAAESDKRDLKSELELMKTLKPHPHVIKLLGCVTESEPLLVLIEYVPYGDLLGYLRKSRGLNDTYYKDPDVKPKTSLTSQQLMKFAWQIADGMSYLSLKKVIHRDLAARNVLVGEKETCKITDFGMARDVQEENIYERKTKGRLPVKWTAYESLLYGQYTTKSDVWSYGVVLYEISTIGGSPYPRIEGRKIVSLLQQGYRMPKPEHVDNELYQIMMNCWQSEPEARPSFNDLTQQLKRMEKQHKNLIKMHIYDNTLYANLEDLNA